MDVINIVDNGNILSVVHMCSDAFRILGTGDIVLADSEGRTDTNVMLTDLQIKNIIKVNQADGTLREILGNAPHDMINGDFVTMKEFILKFPTAILFKVALLDKYNNFHDTATCERIREDLESYNSLLNLL